MKKYLQSIMINITFFVEFPSCLQLTTASLLSPLTHLHKVNTSAVSVAQYAKGAYDR